MVRNGCGSLSLVNPLTGFTRLGHGGIEYVAEVLGYSTRTIERGIDELDQLPDDPAAGRVRRPGGGRKKESSLNRNSNAI